MRDERGSSAHHHLDYPTLHIQPKTNHQPNRRAKLAALDRAEHARAPRQPLTCHVQEALRETVSEFFSRMPTHKCANCNAVNPTVRKQGAAKLFREYSRKALINNLMRGLDMGGDADMRRLMEDQGAVAAAAAEAGGRGAGNAKRKRAEGGSGGGKKGRTESGDEWESEGEGSEGEEEKGAAEKKEEAAAGSEEGSEEEHEEEEEKKKGGGGAKQRGGGGGTKVAAATARM